LNGLSSKECSSHEWCLNLSLQKFTSDLAPEEKFAGMRGKVFLKHGKCQFELAAFFNRKSASIEFNVLELLSKIVSVHFKLIIYNHLYFVNYGLRLLT